MIFRLFTYCCRQQLDLHVLLYRVGLWWRELIVQYGACDLPVFIMNQTRPHASLESALLRLPAFNSIPTRSLWA